MALVRLFVPILAALFALPAAADTAWTPEPFPVAKIVLDEQDVSHFADTHETFEMKDFAPPAGPIGLSTVHPAATILFATTDKNWVDDWHPTPRVQYILVLSGSVEITVEDGETRRFDPGSAVLLEDVRGKGHLSKVVSAEPALFAIVALPDTP